ncbi:LLM class flavin-dependent oxidoreductase, partial [Amycolatopsis sp. NPDC000673]|uniref:LLM class flavin-dependent oxidoreductase n=1 Tax=Amycolatopsis sp. NPDC000673 TaxID=3154267 RepID=UPI00332D338D
MAGKTFRFGVVAAPQEGGAKWRETARRAEDLGYSTLLSPDNLHLPTPTASLAVAAAVTTELRVGTFVFASPLRTPRAAAWEAHSLSVLPSGHQRAFCVRRLPVSEKRIRSERRPQPLLAR